jgi:hypothetical protein
VIVNPETVVGVKDTFAAAPEPSPLIDTSGVEVYPLPRLVKVNSLI